MTAGEQVNALADGDPAAIEIVPGAPLLEAEFDSELVGLSLEQDSCFGFNKSATFVWSQLKQPIAFATLIERVRERYDVDEATCTRDLRDLLGQFEANGLVSLRPISAG